MAGKLIGLIPKNFVITLIENHWWYDMSVRKSRMVSENYKTYNLRQSTSSENLLGTAEANFGNLSPKN